METISIRKSNKPGKKLMITIEDAKGSKTIHIGQSGAMDFTRWFKISPTKALERRQAYINRHMAREDWTKSGIRTAGFWAKHLLWNKPTLEQSILDTKKRFNLNLSLN